jgi:hypothetical protein
VLGSFAISMLVGTAIVLGLAATSLFASRNGPALPSVHVGIGVLILLSAVWLRSARSAALRERAAEARARRRAKKKASRGEKPSRSAEILNR